MTRRTAASAGVAGAALAAGLTLCPTWIRAAGLDVWNMPELNRQCDAEVGRRDRLDDRVHQLHRRNAVKRAIAGELIAGRLGLAEAAADFLAVEATDPWALEGLQAQFPDGPDQKRAALAVLVWVKVRAGRPAEAVARLEAEFRALYPDG
ncbi:MAG: hypothetical protein K2X87_17800 [Gemmataceae bacterium]|nr:hypothetical protein [Gemmataceae bacterium]